MNFDLSGDSHQLEDFEALLNADFTPIQYQGKKKNGANELAYLRDNKQEIITKCSTESGWKQLCLIEYLDAEHGPAEL